MPEPRGFVGSVKIRSNIEYEPIGITYRFAVQHLSACGAA